MNVRYLSKMLYPVGAAVVTAALSAASNGISPQEYVNITIALFTGLLVYVAPNVPESKYVKVAIVAILSVLNFLTSAIVGGLDQSEVLNCLVLLASGLGVYRTANIGDTFDRLTTARHLADAA